MVIGGVLCRTSAAHQLARRVSALHEAQPFPEAIQWKSASAKKLGFYKRVVDLFYQMQGEREIDFACIVFDKRKVDHAKHNENDPEKGFFKFLYQHHLSHSKRLGPERTYRCFHGNMTTRYDLRELRRCLNAGCPKRGLKIYQPYAQVEFRSVKNTRLLQMADLLIGAVGYITNGKQRLAPFAPKSELALYIEEKSPVQSLAEPTRYPDWGFDIWHFRL